jgi:geranylgeranyl transferase type-2 subunit alpha
MHGRRRVSVTEAEKIEQQKKAKLLKREITTVMMALADPSETLSLLTKMVPILPYLNDFSTLWNLRKSHFLGNRTPEQLSEELAISAHVLESNAKSYWAWHHRRWCIEHLDGFDCHPEVELAIGFLAKDSRNFHAWRHRRWAVARCGDLFESELSESYNQISEISNFSAWHYRSQLPNLPSSREEIEHVTTAFWMDSNDQSCWIYYRWLIHRPDIAQDNELLTAQFAGMQELIKLTPNSKYPFLAGIWLQRMLRSPDQNIIAELKTRLAVLDPIRAAYYNEL